MRGIGLLAITAALLLLAASGSASGAALEEVGSFDQPIYVSSDPGNSGRLLIAEREGVVREVRDGGASTVFADIRPLVTCCESERGLLSIAPAPDFHTSGRLYVAYTGTPVAGSAEGDVHVDALSHDAAGALIRQPILTVPHSVNENHNGGQLQFGPDGHLYIGLGDGGGGDDPFNAGQDLDTLLGKLLRIDPRPGSAPAYAIPPGNPFVGREGLDEIWSYGLRNPWRWSFDRSSGDMVIADVGQGTREEIDLAPSPAAGAVGGAGANYGWDCREGTIAHTTDPSPVCATLEASDFTEPVFDYPHEEPEDGSAWGCAITGGYVVRDPALGSLDGRYLYGDFCVGRLRSIDLGAADPPATDRAEPGLSVPAFSLFSFGEDSCGRIYVVDGSGPVYRIVGDEPTVCPPPEPEAAAPGPAPAVVDRRVRPLHAGPRITLHALRRRGRVVGIRARVKPCAGNRGRRLILYRGGHRFAAKRLPQRCVVRFRVRVRRRSSFRAEIPRLRGKPSHPQRTAPPARSPRLVVREGRP
jgi:hypothetical protein